MTLSITTFSIITFSITTFSITTFSIVDLIGLLHSTTIGISIDWDYADSHIFVLLY
jgi:hypothetical protein